MLLHMTKFSATYLLNLQWCNTIFTK